MAKSEYVPERELEHVLALLTWENELVMRVCLHTGLRVGDVVALRAPVKRQFWITEAKTGKRRRVNLTQHLVDLLNRNAGVTQWVFPGRVDPLHKHRTRQAVWADVDRARKALRLPMTVSPHSARKVYAVETLARNGGDLEGVRKALNHDDSATTAIYALAEALYRSKYVQQEGRTRRKKKRPR